MIGLFNEFLQSIRHEEMCLKYKGEQICIGSCYVGVCILIEATDINKINMPLKLYTYTSGMRTPIPTSETLG